MRQLPIRTKLESWGDVVGIHHDGDTQRALSTRSRFSDYRSVRCGCAAACAACLWLYLARRDSNRRADGVAFGRIFLSDCYGDQAEALSGA